MESVETSEVPPPSWPSIYVEPTGSISIVMPVEVRLKRYQSTSVLPRSIERFSITSVSVSVPRLDGSRLLSLFSYGSP